MYNPNGKNKTSNYKFPFDDESFDFVFLFSVFTHLVLEDMKNYLFEISRVLKREGKCMITFFLLNENISSTELEIGGEKLKYQFEGYRSIDSKMPEQAIAYEENLIRKLFAECGLEIDEPLKLYFLDRI